MKTALLLAAALFASSCGDDTKPSGQDNDAGKQDYHVNDVAKAADCQAAWNAAHAYSGGDVATLNGTNYRANWWTQGDSPATHSGQAGSGQPWVSLGACGQPAASPTPKPAPTPIAPITPTPTAAPTTATPAGYPWIAPYKDVTISANWNTSVISTSVTGTLQPLLTAAPGLPMTVWAFATGECGNENFGGIPGATLAAANVPAWKAVGESFIVSTGGAAGSFTCGSDAGFAAFIDRYSGGPLVGIDFDIEAGQSQATIDALVARVKAAQANSKYKHLRFSFTLATLGGSSPQSLGDAGVTVMRSIKAAGLQGYVINLMAMDYGSPLASNCTLAQNNLCNMGQSAIQAAKNLHDFYALPYSQIALTPMIGGNDTQSETFTLQDAATLLAFAKSKGLAGVHFWSLDRDKDCPPGYASPTCNSYGKAGAFGFTKAFLGH